MFYPSNHTRFCLFPLERGAGFVKSQSNLNGESNAEQAANIEELQKVNEELKQARRAALNLMEDALLSKEALQRSEAQLAKELADSQQLQQVSSSLIEADNDELLYEEIINASKNIMHSQAVSMQMFVPEKNALRLLVWKGFHPESAKFWEWVSADSESSCGFAFAKNKRIIIPDVENSEYINGEDLEAYRLSGIRAVQSTPLISRSGKIVGMLSNHWAEVYQPSERELGLLNVLARQTADVMERKTAEQALQTSEERLRTLADAVPQVIWANDAEGKANYFNKRWYEYAGLNYEQSAGPGWQVIVHPDDAPASKEKWQQALATGEIFDAEYRLKKYDGEYRWFIGRNVPLKDEAGKVTGWFGSATDIQELKEVQEALSQSESRLRITMESAADYAIITMNNTGEIERWSCGAEKIFGYKEQEVLGKPADIIFTPEDKAADAPKKEMETAAIEGRASDERWHQRKDGTRFFMSGVMAPIYDGALTGFVKVAQDITERKLVEQQKDEFIGIASHELKTPVTSIKAYAELLLETVTEKLDAEDEQLIVKLDKQIDRLIGLIHSLLDTTKIAEGQLFLSPENFDLNELTAEKIQELQRTTNKHVLKLVSDKNVIIKADKKRIEEVITNLISNALKYSPNGGEVLITIEKKPENIQVNIKDTGIGIPEYAKTKLFGRFFRVQNAQIETYPGMGLGLYIASAIIKQHNGKMWVNSKINEGSTFHFSLPYG